MIKPVNGHLLIEPVKHEAFMATSRETYQEIGIVIECDDAFLVPDGSLVSPFSASYMPPTMTVKAGDKVYFDAWLAARYPKEGGKDEDFYWLVKWEDVRAIEHVEPEPIPK